MKAISVENLSKLYILGAAKHNSLRDTIMSVFSKPLSKSEKQELWALRDVSFTVDEGESIGLIGKNGAGKSTLLKVLSRITKPTFGEAEIRGRVGSLLEVGTGFHSELTGRENIFLNGAILGMKHKEIIQKFDEIVDFSEIEKFLDTPAKHYSSGMFMRLAFAVAAHLEPEILIVDEVLAVGDMAFQKKCLNKMQDVGQEGRTVLFVSHNLQSISRLCQRAIWIENGKIREDGDAQKVVGNYLNVQASFEGERVWKDLANAPGDEFVKLRRVRAANASGENSSAFAINRPIFLEMTYEVVKTGKFFTPGFQVYNDEGICVFVSKDVSLEWRGKLREEGVYTSRVEIPANFMAEGSFFITAAAFNTQNNGTLFSEREIFGFHVFDSIEGDTARGDFGGTMKGIVRPLLQWETELETKRKAS